MKTSKQIQGTTRARSPAVMFENRRVRVDDDLIDLFPQSRYFQVHFQHMHENTYKLQAELDQLKQYVSKVDEKLEHLIALLSPDTEQVTT